MEYPALFSPDPEKGGFVVTFPDFSWGVTQGDSAQEAMEMAADLLHILIADRIEKQEALPRIQKRRGARYRLVRLPALEAAKALLYSEWLRSGIRKAELARRMGIPKSNIDRLFDLRHPFAPRSHRCGVPGSPQGAIDQRKKRGLTPLADLLALFHKVTR